MNSLLGSTKTAGCTEAKHKCEKKDSLKLLEIGLIFMPVVTQCVYR